MTPPPSFNVLLFSKTSAYRHSSIPAAISAIRALSTTTTTPSYSNLPLFTIHATEDAEEAFTAASLAQYAVVVLLQCTGDFLNAAQLGALKNFVEQGGGVVGIHACTAGMLGDAWYKDLLGARFKAHPEPQRGRVVVEDPAHFVLTGASSNTRNPSKDGNGGGEVVKEGWMDEWYNFTSHPRENKELRVLMRADTTTFEGGEMGADHPLSWCRERGQRGGRMWYTALGHFEEAYGDEWFMGQVGRGIVWVAGREGEFKACSAK